MNDFAGEKFDFPGEKTDFANQEFDFASQMNDFADEKIDFAGQEFEFLCRKIEFADEEIEFPDRMNDFAGQKIEFADRMDGSTEARRRLRVPPQLRQKLGQLRSDAPQLGAVRGGEAGQCASPFGCETNTDLTAIVVGAHTFDQILCGQAVDEAYGAVRAHREFDRDLADRHRPILFPPEREESLMLLRCQACEARGLFAEPEKTPKRRSESRQHAELSVAHRFGHGDILLRASIVLRYIFPAPRFFVRTPWRSLRSDDR